MTRASFAATIKKYWVEHCTMPKDEDLLAYANRTNHGTPNDIVAVVIADVATNGFDPEPVTIDRQAQMRVVEQLGEAAKRSRPFVGSHKFPFDSDWD